MKPNLLFGLVLTACGAAPPELERPERIASEPRELSIVGTNDLHGKLEALPFLAGYLENVRAERPVVLVDAGDLFQGTLASNLDQGAMVIEAYGAIGYHAAALGNHEFDWGKDVLRARVREARFAMLSANLVDAKTRAPVEWQGLSRSTLVEVAGTKIGIVGALTEETPSIVMPGLLTGLDVVPIAETAAREANALREHGARLVILVAHAGGACERFDDPKNLSSCKPDSEIARVVEALPEGTFDAVFAGHTHQGMAHFVRGVPVMEAYANGVAFSRIDVRFDDAPSLKLHPPRFLCDDRRASFADCRPGDYAGKPVRADARIRAIVAPVLAQAEARRKAPVGISLASSIDESFTRESELGNLFADLLREAADDAAVGLMNGGGLRAPLPAGPLLYGSLHEAMPFDNRLAVVEVSAAELAALIAKHLTSDKHGILSVSGMRVRAQCKAGELEVTLARDGDKPIADDERVRIATSDYLATGGDELFSIPRERVSLTSELVRDAFARLLSARGGTLDPENPALVDPARPRIALPQPRPVRCP